jgi:hypothetical protein
MKAIIMTPPSEHQEIPIGYKSIFLAGSIGQTQIDWQQEIINSVKDFKKVIFNPRRENWDNSWDNSIDNLQFVEQVNWELYNLERADMIIMNLVPETLSPISLLEFGMYAKSNKLVVYCPDKFYRKGNIDVVCKRYNIPQVEKFEELITLIKYTH